MTRTRELRAATAVVTAVLLAGGSLAIGGAATATPQKQAATSDIDYFAAAYPGLRSNSVFETATFERFEFLLQSEGTYAFLIGGPDDANTAATIGHIDAVAQSYGVDTVYNFNPKLDGNTLDVRTSTNPVVAELYDRLLVNHLNKDTQTVFDKSASDPYLFIYDAAHTVGGAEDRIVAAIDVKKTAAELADAGTASAYRSSVAALFDTVATVDPATGAKVAALDTRDQFDFISTQNNARHKKTYVDASIYGGDILTAADADFRLQSITYPELVNVLKSDGDHIILFGGTWCHNTRAVVKQINDQARANGVPTVYFFDLRIDGISGNALHIRDTASPFAHLYGDLVDTYLTNLVTQYDATGTNPGQRVSYYPGGDTSLPLKVAKKLQVPYLFEYNKNHTDAAGQPAPVVQQWIHDNGDGTFKEYMTEWWWVLGLNGNGRNVESSQAFAAEAVASVATFFSAVPQKSGEVPTVPTDPTVPTPAPTNPGVPAPTPTTPAPVAAVDPTTVAGSVGVAGTDSRVLRPGAKITVTASGLAPNTAGFVVEIRSTPQRLGIAATDAAGRLSLTATLPAGLAAGAHTVVVLLNGVVVASEGVTIAADGSARSLAQTGTDGGQLFWLSGFAVLVIALGAGALVVRHRRNVVRD